MSAPWSGQIPQRTAAEWRDARRTGGTGEKVFVGAGEHAVTGVGDRPCLARSPGGFAHRTNGATLRRADGGRELGVSENARRDYRTPSARAAPLLVSTGSGCSVESVAGLEYVAIANPVEVAVIVCVAPLASGSRKQIKLSDDHP